MIRFQSWKLLTVVLLKKLFICRREESFGSKTFISHPLYHYLVLTIPSVQPTLPAISLPINLLLWILIPDEQFLMSWNFIDISRTRLLSLSVIIHLYLEQYIAFESAKYDSQLSTQVLWYTYLSSQNYE